MSDHSPFDDSEYLRQVLIRLYAHGPNAWNTDPEADDLLRYTMDRFAQLARKHGLEPEDACSVAFEVMRSPSAWFGQDPWAVVVTSVATTLRALEFADEALCSLETAKRGGLSGIHPIRLSERETPLWEHHPEFAVQFRSEFDDDEDDVPDDQPSLHEQAAILAVLFCAHGWKLDTAWTAIEVVMRRLADAGSRSRAFERLRKDRHARVITDLPARSWSTLLRLLLGSPDSEQAFIAGGKGILLRLALGETTTDLEDDEDLTTAIAAAAPRLMRGR